MFLEHSNSRRLHALKKEKDKTFVCKKRQVKRNISMCLYPRGHKSKCLQRSSWCLRFEPLLGGLGLKNSLHLRLRQSLSRTIWAKGMWGLAHSSTFLLLFFLLKGLWRSCMSSGESLQLGCCSCRTLFHNSNSSYISQQNFFNNTNKFPQSCHPQHFRNSFKEIALNLVGPKSVKLAISDASVLYVVIVFPVFLAVHFPVIISFTILMFTCVSFPSCPCA